MLLSDRRELLSLQLGGLHGLAGADLLGERLGLIRASWGERLHGRLDEGESNDGQLSPYEGMGMEVTYELLLDRHVLLLVRPAVHERKEGLGDNTRNEEPGDAGDLGGEVVPGGPERGDVIEEGGAAGKRGCSADGDRRGSRRQG